MQAKNKKNSRSFANLRGLNFSSKLKRKNVGGVSLLFKLSGMNFTFVNSTVRPSFWNFHF